MNKTTADLIQEAHIRPDFDYYVLENGLRVVLCRDVFKPKVSVGVTYHAGSA